ncbi:MAG: serpin family protein [Chlamydiia bacterium]|nr:serpin family protein [Chlamydiia bacterium]
MRKFLFLCCLTITSLQALPRVPVYQVVRSNNGFGLAYFTYMARAKERNNFAFSPYGISASMAVAYLGSKEKTEKQIADILFYPLTPNFLGETFKRFNADFATDDALGNATAMWVEKNLPLKQEFISRAEQYYENHFFQGDFVLRVDTTRNEINKWVAKETNKTIPFFMGVSDMPRGLKMLLVATMTLNASWEEPFSPRLTKTENFFTDNIRQRKVPMMQKEGVFPFYETEDLKVLEIPYAQPEGQKTRLGFWMVLPKKVEGLKNLEKNLSITGFEDWRKNAVRKRVKVKIPRFRVIEVLRAEKYLEEMGLSLPFQEDADFSEMTEDTAFVGRIFQKTFFSIDERGTHSKKFVSTRPSFQTDLADEEVKEFFVDHPFMFFVLDNSTGQLLFLGHIIQP